MEAQTPQENRVKLTKAFKEYFFEGIMIFIAVTVGFFAENFREYLSEQSVKKEKVSSIYEDLKNDSLFLHYYEIRNDEDLRKIDSLILLLKSSKIDSSLRDLYFYARRATRVSFYNFRFNRTFEQQQNSDSPWFINNKELSDSIILYYTTISITTSRDQENSEKEMYNLHPYLSKIFDATVFVEMTSNDGNISRPKLPKPLLTTNPAIINQFIFYLDQLRGSYIMNKAKVRFFKDFNKKLLEKVREYQK